MPDISELNGNAVANLSEVDGLAKANILNIDGLEVTDPGINPTAPTSGFLFTYSGAAAGYSVRQLNNNADQIMRVRRASDNVEADVGFDASNELSLTSPISNTSDALSYTDLADFVDHTGTPTNAFVRYWYDQTGLQNHSEQGTGATQPQIYDATTGIIEEGVAGFEKPAIHFDALSVADSNLVMASAVSAVTMSTVVKVDANATSSNSYLWSNTIVSQGSGFHGGGLSSSRTGYGVQIITPTTESFQGTTEDFYQHLVTYHDGATDTLFQDGSSYATGALTNTPSVQRLGSRGYYQLSLDGKLQELVLWNTSTQQSNRTAIETNINTYYGVYPTSGLLVDYPGSYRAYSLRKLQNLAGYAIRVQRHSAPFDEQDIGFTASGDLDTQAIINFAGTDVVGVKTWYNQVYRNSAQDLTQSNTAYQPLIFDGTSVYQSNGKPAIYYDATDKQLDDTSGSGTGVNTDFFNVHQRNSGTGYFLHWYLGNFQAARMTTQYVLGWSGGTTGPAVDTDQHVFTGIATGTTGQIRLDGTASTAGTLDGSRRFGGKFAIQGRPGFPGSNPGPGDIYHQEFIQYDFNNTGADVTAIENDIKTYYGIP